MGQALQVLAYVILVHHIFAARSRYAVHLAEKQQLPTFKVFWYDSAQTIRTPYGI